MIGSIQAARVVLDYHKLRFHYTTVACARSCSSPSPPSLAACPGLIVILAFLFPTGKASTAWLNLKVARASKHTTCNVEIVFEDAPVYFRQRALPCTSGSGRT